jgi:hypothetical protein
MSTLNGKFMWDRELDHCDEILWDCIDYGVKVSYETYSDGYPRVRVCLNDGDVESVEKIIRENE